MPYWGLNCGVSPDLLAWEADNTLHLNKSHFENVNYTLLGSDLLTVSETVVSTKMITRLGASVAARGFIYAPAGHS